MSILTLLFLPVRVLEQTGDPSALVEAGPNLTRYLLISAAMVFVVGGLGWVLQRTLGNSGKLRASKRALRIVDVLPLGGKKKLAVVRVYDRTFVLGLGDREISVVSELNAGMGESDVITPEPKRHKASGIARAFEAIRARVGEGVPQPQPQPPALRKRELSRMEAAVGQAVRKSPKPEAQAAPVRASAKTLGNGRGLLG